MVVNDNFYVFVFFACLEISDYGHIGKVDREDIK